MKMLPQSPTNDQRPALYRREVEVDNVMAGDGPPILVGGVRHPGDEAGWPDAVVRGERGNLV